MQRPPRSAAKEKDKDFYDDTWDGEVSDETMEDQPTEETHNNNNNNNNVKVHAHLLFLLPY